MDDKEYWRQEEKQSDMNANQLVFDGDARINDHAGSIGKDVKKDAVSTMYTPVLSLANSMKDAA